MNSTDQVPSTPQPDLCVARVIEARDHPNADRLVVMDIDLGQEQRQIVAGIRGQYDNSELSGLHLVVVANLEPARLRGEISQGMLLAAEEGDTLGLLLAPGAAPGTRIRVAGEGEPAPSMSFKEFMELDLIARPDGVTLDGQPLQGADLTMDRAVYGKLR
jgi:methionyl-tRNA synthetase